jgi:hypothetical protein
MVSGVIRLSTDFASLSPATPAPYWCATLARPAAQFGDGNVATWQPHR